MLQVSPFKCTLGLFKAAGNILKPNALMITYHPLAFNGVIEPQSNRDFDLELKSKNPEWGIRDLSDLKKIGEVNGIEFQQLYDLPANNKCVIWKKIQ
ncbi:Protein of unknown function (DUF938) [Popillia japonica]|uniref:DUF938 domain-containing protein n=1 Tax=Popillia japonica TaxID=7064 RepID=A0AAW1NL40_POPJA